MIIPFYFAIGKRCNFGKYMQQSKTLLFIFFSLSVLLTFPAFSQKKTASINGRVLDVDERPMKGVSVIILGKQTGISTNDSGNFSIIVPSGKAFALIFSYTGFKTLQKNFFLSRAENETVTIELEKGETELDNVNVTNVKSNPIRGSLITINPKLIINNPSPITGVESMVKILVGSNNELTSQYNVRGGSFDENLVYVNDFEIFRPYLVSNGQQEGLSFINPEMTKNVNFYNGGYPTKYGDKMSSVLDVTYKKPTHFGGSAYIGLLEQGLHLEGISKDSSVTYLFGVRNRSLRNLLASQETVGNYIPSSSDVQAYITWQASRRWFLEFLGNASGTHFTFFPEQSTKSTSVFSPLYTQTLGLQVYFGGQERDKYNTSMLGLSATYQIKPNFKLKGMLSRFEDNEQENIDITGAYLFGELDIDKGSSTFGKVINPLGAGIYQNYARNKLDVQVYNASLKGTIEKGRHYIQFGNSISLETIDNTIKQWQYQDSAGYSLHYQPGNLTLFNSIHGNNNYNRTRLQGYAQDNIKMGDYFTMQAGIRYNYNNLNNELVVSPRVGISFTPAKWKKDIVFRASAGIYDQPPFFREMIRQDGMVNTALKSQKSFQISTGIDYNFKMMDRPFRLNSELYYKNMTDVVPYDVDNVHLQYFATNNAKAYAYGGEVRLFGELVKGAESWVSLGLAKTMEDLQGDFFYRYYNAAHQEITASSTDRIPTDSSKTNVGYVRRPTDRRITLGVFFQDYLSTNQNFKVYLNILYGSNLPYNIPGSVKYRNALEIPAYIRTDIGFSALLMDNDKSKRRSHNPLRGLDNMWLTFEVFNLIDRDNTISYQLIKDFSNNTYAIPNRLTPRLINLKLVTRW